MADTLDITPNSDNSLEVVRPARKSNNLAIPEPQNAPLDTHGQQDNLSSLSPHAVASVDQVQEWKTWLQENNGTILAAMLQRIPTPVTRRITWGEFVALFDLNFDPSDDLSKELDSILTTFPEWVRKFSFSYMSVATATSRINSDSKNFNSKLSVIAEKLNDSSSQPLDDNFRKLFS